MELAEDGDKESLMDTPIFVANRALFQEWYRLNSPDAQDQDWRVY